MNYSDNANKPKEADEWYKQALERARNIAKNIGQSSSTSKGPMNDINSPTSSGDSIIYSPPNQKHTPNYGIGKIRHTIPTLTIAGKNSFVYYRTFTNYFFLFNQNKNLTLVFLHHQFYQLWCISLRHQWVVDMVIILFPQMQSLIWENRNKTMNRIKANTPHLNLLVHQQNWKQVSQTLLKLKAKVSIRWIKNVRRLFVMI